MRLDGRLARVSPWILLGVGWLGIVIYAFPGLMTMDSVEQLQEARASFYTDAHPPVMAVLWHGVDKVIAGPFGMLVIQVTAFELGIFLLLRRALSPLRAAIATVCILWFPPVLAPMAVIWKDCLMAGMFVLGIAAMFDERRWVKGLGLAAFWLATAVRYNAPAATFAPIVLLFTWPLARGFDRGVRRYALAAVVWIGITGSAIAVDGCLTDQEMHFWHSTLALMDTAGAIAETDRAIPDEELRPLVAGTGFLVDKDIQAAIRGRYSPVDFEQLTYREGHVWAEMPIMGTTPAPKERLDAIERMFWSAVTTYTGGYMKHRALTMKYVLALPGGPVYGPVRMHRMQYPKLLAELGVRTDWAWWQDWMQRKVNTVAKKTPLFRPWMYLVVALILLGFCRGQRDVFVILLSGIGLESSLFLLAPTPDYRYSHWLVTTTLIAVVMLVARRAQRARTDAKTDATAAVRAAPVALALAAALCGCASPADPDPPLGCRDGAGACVDLRFVAHQDDDLLFMNPDVVASIANGHDVTTVYLTAGTGGDPVRLAAREAGILNAYSYMVSPDLAVTDPANRDTMLASWTLHDGAPIELATTAGPRHAVQYDFAATTPAGAKLSVVFVRLVERNGMTDLAALWEGRVGTIASVACPSDCVLGSVTTAESYDSATLVEVLDALMTRFEDPQRAFAVSTLDATGLFELGDGYGEGWIDNSDHVATAMFAMTAFVDHLASEGSTRRTIDQYRGYDIGEEPNNLGDETLEKRRAFYRYYALGEDLSYTNQDPDDPVFTLGTYNHWTRRRYGIASEAPRTGKLQVPGPESGPGEAACLVATDSTLALGNCDTAPTWESTAGFQLQLAGASPQPSFYIFTHTGQIRTKSAQCLQADDAGVRAMPCDKLLDDAGNPVGAPIRAQAWRWLD